MSQLFSYVPVMHEGRCAYEVIDRNGRGTGIIRNTPRSANGAAQTLNNNARSLIRQRARKGVNANAASTGSGA